ncbi:unnamed protein product [Rotaria sp. Silwood2]|nr:unnamed protein product [Rotaria sp. Silwood2]CAF2910179.1 unnamed protein product [Rotaria sp. Silwood2]CAF3066896.1 unnamed protein product [Rotaria sp. Silwood2]CAF3909430.1 unnamed protein product [Rotaria sp. Silwood2]CAF4004266.1 unnamed protein product [Rotaria sp. Silwood2]
MTTAIFLLTLSFAYILLGTCAQFTIAIFTSDLLLNLPWQHFPFFIIIQAIFICLFFISGFRRDSFVFLYPFLLTLFLHLCSNLWYILNIIHLRKYQSIEIQQFFYYCSNEILNMNIDTKQCTCIRDNYHDKYLVNMSCIKVKLLIELIQLMPFISILLVLADFYTSILVAFVYVYEKRSLIDYLPTPDEYDLP